MDGITNHVYAHVITLQVITCSLLWKSVTAEKIESSPFEVACAL